MEITIWEERDELGNEMANFWEDDGEFSSETQGIYSCFAQPVFRNTFLNPSRRESNVMGNVNDTL
jgi:hypothetical protein